MLHSKQYGDTCNSILRLPKKYPQIIKQQPVILQGGFARTVEKEKTLS